MSDIIWEHLPEKKRKRLQKKIGRLARKFAKIDYSRPARTKLVTKIKFALCRFIQRRVRKKGIAGLDNQYWYDNGWLDKRRPWKT